MLPHSGLNAVCYRYCPPANCRGPYHDKHARPRQPCSYCFCFVCFVGGLFCPSFPFLCPLDKCITTPWATPPTATPTQVIHPYMDICETTTSTKLQFQLISNFFVMMSVLSKFVQSKFVGLKLTNYVTCCAIWWPIWAAQKYIFVNWHKFWNGGIWAARSSLPEVIWLLTSHPHSESKKQNGGICPDAPVDRISSTIYTHMYFRVAQMCQLPFR